MHHQPDIVRITECNKHPAISYIYTVCAQELVRKTSHLHASALMHIACYISQKRAENRYVVVQQIYEAHFDEEIQTPNSEPEPEPEDDDYVQKLANNFCDSRILASLSAIACTNFLLVSLLCEPLIGLLVWEKQCSYWYKGPGTKA